MPMAAVELKHHVCCTQKPSTGYPATNSFPTMATHFVMDMHTPPTSPLNIKRFFKHRFRNMDLLSSAHHLGFPSRTNLCVPPQPACFGESCLTLGTRIMFCYSVKICDQIFQGKGTFTVNLISSNPLLEMAFNQREIPLVEPLPSNSIIV